MTGQTNIVQISAPPADLGAPAPTSTIPGLLVHVVSRDYDLDLRDPRDLAPIRTFDAAVMLGVTPDDLIVELRRLGVEIDDDGRGFAAR
jgi:hypothetical protein